MIRYTITPAELRRRITQVSATWLTRAAAATERLVVEGPIDLSAPKWSDIKAVYMKLQHSKCVFCERDLAHPDFGRVEHDVEHFRPKGKVTAWPYDFPTGPPDPNGYYLLTFEPLNYATSCKPCNSTLRGTYFPIAATRVTSPDPLAYEAEQPYLPFPIGNRGRDPEAILRFTGVTAVPRYATGHAHRMARVTIDLFALNIRSTLLHQRARLITHLFLAATLRRSALHHGAPAMVELADTAIANLTAPHAPTPTAPAAS